MGHVAEFVTCLCLMPGYAQIHRNDGCIVVHCRPSLAIGRVRSGTDVRRMVNEAHPPRASDIDELQALQKQQKVRDEFQQEKMFQSLSSTLKSSARLHGPRILKGDTRASSVPQSPRSLENQTSGFMKAMSDAGLRPVIVYHNLSTAELYEKALAHEKGTHIVSSGALATLSGAKTGRSPKDKRIVRHAKSEGDIWWAREDSASPNYEMDETTFLLNRERAVDYLNMQDKLYVFDGFAGWDPVSRIKIRVVAARPYHALFMNNMLVRPSEEELADFGKPEFTIYNAGAFPANRFTSYMTSTTSIDISIEHKEMVILGAQYAGEMKKGIFSLVNYWLPNKGILPLHSGCNVGKAGDASLFFGLSGTGKTTLSADQERYIIGDDEHAWGDDGVFGIEGGCYAKAIGLNQKSEPGIYDAIKFGAVLENVVFDEESREVDFDNDSITENTRACYPIGHMVNAHMPCIASHPKNIIMLCCDAFGVLPPVAKLTKDQAIYYFLSGYTSTVSEIGHKTGMQPEAKFSACFGSAFLVWHPSTYASMLAEKIEKHNTNVWMVNTGWTGGIYGVGCRIKLKYTKAIIDAIHSGELVDVETDRLLPFNLSIPRCVAGTPENILNPENAWPDKVMYRSTAQSLALQFIKNFDSFRGSQAPGIAEAGPAV